MSTLRRFRSAVTGRYTSQAIATANPETTVSEAQTNRYDATIRAAIHLDRALATAYNPDTDLLDGDVITAWADLRAALGRP